jgi:hypothetical protein
MKQRMQWIKMKEKNTRAIQENQEKITTSEWQAKREAHRHTLYT